MKAKIAPRMTTLTARVREWLRWREALLTVPPIMGKKMAGQHHAPIKAGKEHASVASDTTTPWRALAFRTSSASASCASQLAGQSLSDTAALVSRSTTWSGAGATASSATDCGLTALSPPWPAARAGGCQQSCIDQLCFQEYLRRRLRPRLASLVLEQKQ